jgi:hypothetical protein
MRPRSIGEADAVERRPALHLRLRRRPRHTRVDVGEAGDAAAGGAELRIGEREIDLAGHAQIERALAVDGRGARGADRADTRAGERRVERGAAAAEAAIGVESQRRQAV